MPEAESLARMPLSDRNMTNGWFACNSETAFSRNVVDTVKDSRGSVNERRRNARRVFRRSGRHTTCVHSHTVKESSYTANQAIFASEYKRVNFSLDKFAGL
jgi:hypothetical protein